METWRGFEATPEGWPASAVAIGVFDGVHRGHAALVKAAIKAADERVARSVVVTFDPHPTAVVAPSAVPPKLTSLDRRVELLGELGVDGVCVLPFTEELSRLGPDRFIEHLVRTTGAVAVVVGENFRFGHKAAGDVGTLRELGERLSFEALPQPLTADGAAYSSTRVRALLAEGDVVGAAEILGRPFGVEGAVVHGSGRGVDLGFPTANIEPVPGLAVPADGVYTGWLHHDSRRHPAAISVGTNPTFGENARTVEAFVLDFSGDLYEAEVRLDFVSRLRGQIAFDAVDALAEQIETDVAQTRAALELD
ncbi:bifunctional riboflavin kinase/FAD synthetase [Glycomyces xiaoerkulensis]|uniref:bifunctional riboflavin kinase/FAD synthetase n=1 Tax=Glycomyces xiaoerkulensis TaxID=2038139 RepID=UPI000C25E482|nr:bifunctional riboflavin kinase/FAD synthetase [Glycomyces xiaoerkulensis]